MMGRRRRVAYVTLPPIWLADSRLTRFGFVPTPKWSPSGIDDTILLYIVMLIFSVWNARVTETRDRAVEPMMIIRLRWIIIHQ
jgi:hypothetical protein